MKEKILFWISGDLIHFCLSYNLQKKYDAEYYAIIDVPSRLRSFFEMQKFVKFKKIWFFNDYAQNIQNKPDTKYLSKFEKKFDINLWKYVINERIFYGFFTFHKFKGNEILRILEQECKFFEMVLNEINPNFLITREASRHHHQLFCDICNTEGINVLMLSQVKMAYRTMISQQSHKLPFSKSLSQIVRKDLSFEQIQSKLKSHDVSKQLLSYVKSDSRSIHKKIKPALEYLFSKNSSETVDYYYFGRTKFRVILNLISSALKRKYRKWYIDRNLVKSFFPSKKFVYYPMALNMERNLLITAPFYTNQIEIIRHIAKSIPVDYELLVKENPIAVTRGWQKISIYKEIKDIPNVILLHPSYDTKEIYQKSSLVISIGGTSSFEAAFYGKPSIVFSDQIYNILPSILRIKNIEELPDVIRTALQITVNPVDVTKYLDLINFNTFDYDFLGFSTLIKDKFFHEGFLLNTKIDVNTMESFLEVQNKVLDNLALEHVKRLEMLSVYE